MSDYNSEMKRLYLNSFRTRLFWKFTYIIDLAIHIKDLRRWMRSEATGGNDHTKYRLEKAFVIQCASVLVALRQK